MPFKIKTLNLRSKFTLHDTDFVTAPADFLIDFSGASQDTLTSLGFKKISEQ